MLAASDAIDLGRLLLDLLIVLVAAKAAAELAERIRAPAVLGEIVAGILIGPSVLGLIELDGARGVSLGLLAEIGVLLLLLSVGMEMDLAELGKVGRASLLVALVGVAAPFAAGAAVGLAFGESVETAVFFGAALTATSVGITARVFGDLRALASIEARIVLGAAVADDVLGLVILTVVVKAVTGGGVGVGTVLGTAALALGFLIVTGIVGILGVPPLLRVIDRRSKSAAALTVAALAVTLGFAALADTAKLAFIIGAFMAGLAIGKSEHHERVARDLGAVGHVFIPIFFLQIGINADLEAMADPTVLLLAAAMTVVAVVGKLVSAVGASGTRADKLLLGIGMIPRGEVGLIFASIGLANGVLDDDQYGALLLVVLVSTVITPPLLRLRLGATAAVSPFDDTPTEEPARGWLDVVDGRIELNGVPPVSSTVGLALAAAARTPETTPGESLLEWFSAHRDAPLRWSTDDTPALVELLRADEPRAWRFLDVTGVLERALPEIATSMARRRADMSDLDPLGSLRFPTVDRLHDVMTDDDGDKVDNDDGDGGDKDVGRAVWRDEAVPSDELVLAAMVVDVTRRDEHTWSLAARLVPEAAAERLTSLVDDARLLRAGVREPPRLDDVEVLQLATHLATAEHAEDAYRLALALGEMTRNQHATIAERATRIREALDHPELTGSDALNLANARRLAAQRLLHDAAPIERLRFASASYLLAHAPEELARQARLVEPLPRSGSVRVAVSPEPEPDHWKIDIACRDADGLLSRLTDVVTRQGLDIVSADIATWPDGAILDSFVVRSGARPSPRELALEMEERLRRGVRAVAMPELALTFDNDALPWHTACTVEGPDQPGVLQAVSAAFATAKVVVHSARISSTGSSVNDRFAVTDRLERKLDQAAMDRIRAALAGQRGRFARR